MFQFVWTQIRIQQAPAVIFIKQTQEAKAGRARGDQNQEPVQTAESKEGEVGNTRGRHSSQQT